MRSLNEPWVVCTDLTACSYVKAEGGGGQSGTALQGQATDLGNQQEVKGCPGQLLGAAEQQRQLLHQFTRYRWSEQVEEG